MNTQYRQLLYLSHLAPGAGYEQLSAICKASRQHNAELQLGGVLLFDGYRFCGLLEGPGESVEAMRSTIGVDKRHERMIVLVDRVLREFASPKAWVSGYCDSDELDVIEAAEGLSEDQVLATCRAIAARSHLSP